MAEIEGGCHCGAVRYRISGKARGHALCHCTDCRRASGAPLVGWAMFPADAVTVVKGAVKTYASSETGRHDFCADCGSGLFYRNDVNLPGLIDVQSGTFDDPDTLPPRVHIQVADRIGWAGHMHELPAFERFPPMDGDG